MEIEWRIEIKALLLAVWRLFQVTTWVYERIHSTYPYSYVQVKYADGKTRLDMCSTTVRIGAVAMLSAFRIRFPLPSVQILGGLIFTLSTVWEYLRHGI